jgi:beta-mannosidase
MAMNWCFNEPWITAANQAIVSYPAIPKASYQCVKDALRPVLPSLKAYKLHYTGGDEFEGELWLLNDSQEKVKASIEIFVEVHGEERHLMTWNTEESEIDTNIKGHTIRFKIPENLDGEFDVVLKSGYGNSCYRFFSKPAVRKEYTKGLNA